MSQKLSARRVAPALVILLQVPTLCAASTGVQEDPEGIWPAPETEWRVRSEARNYDGSDNNAAHSDWGRAGTPLLRHMLGIGYADGSTEPPAAGLPGARAVSNAVAAQAASVPNSAGLSDFFWQWGQFLDHDVDLTPGMVPVEPFAIPVPAGDPMFDPSGTGGVSIPFSRSEYHMVSGVRQQMNAITAFIDASNVYGSDDARARELRRLDGTGKLKTSAGRMLPFNENGFANAPSSAPDLFLAGDVRANEQVGLTALHILFVREHNWLCGRLRDVQPDWTGEQVYAMARAIVGAEIQVITYREFLPLLLGPDALSPYTGYKPHVNPGIDNAFSTAAYRLGHSMVSDELLRLKRNGTPIAEGNLALARSFFAPHEIREAGGIEPLLRGLATQRAQEIDLFVVDALRNFLFGPPGAGGFDLAALNIQRGRDHGMLRYNECRRQLGLTPCSSFSQVTSDTDAQATLASVYDDVEQIDLWVGGLAEDRIAGAVVGELFFTILKDQFERLRDGDRFWYEADFMPWMVQWLEGQTLAGIIRRNTSIGHEIQDFVLEVPAVQLAQKSLPPHAEAGAAAAGTGTVLAAFPNPARTNSGVWLSLPPDVNGLIEIGIYDVRGRHVRTLQAPAGTESVIHWDARTSHGRPAQAGVYFVRIHGRDFVARRRVLLVE